MGMDILSLCSFVRIMEEWVMRLLMPMSCRVEGLTRKWKPACNPTHKVPLSSSGRTMGTGGR